MTQQEFIQASHRHADQAWRNARLFELLATAYSALARGHKSDWDNALVKLGALPKDDLFTAQIRELHATVCDRGWDDELSMVASEIYHAMESIRV